MATIVASCIWSVAHSAYAGWIEEVELSHIELIWLSRLGVVSELQHMLVETQVDGCCVSYLYLWLSNTRQVDFNHVRWN